jgi:hypothetical protein
LACHVFEIRNCGARWADRWKREGVPREKRKILDKICVLSNFRLDRGFMGMSCALAA